MEGVKILVCGGRNYCSYEGIELGIQEAVSSTTDSPDDRYVETLVHGNAKGADWLAKAWAVDRGVTQIPYDADWKTYGSAAGPKRNKQMLDEHPDIDLVVAFPGGKGTANMVKQARERGFEVYEVDDEWYI